MLLRLTLSIVLCTCFLLSQAQQNAQRIDSRQLIETGTRLYDEGKYKEALSEFEKVPVGDTNYIMALYESALVCSADSQYARGISLCQKALADDSRPELMPDLLVLYGALLDYNDQKEESLRVLDSAIQVYSATTSLYINKATTLIRMKRYKDAEKVLQQAALIDPYSASVHFKMAISALNQGKVVPSILALLTSLAVEPENANFANIITLLNEICRSSDEIVELVNNRTEDPSENFGTIEQIVLSKIALDKKYKIIIELDDNISRQMQVVFEKLRYDESDQDFYMQYHVPVFKKIYDDKKFEYFVNYVFSGVNIPAIQNFNKKKKKDIDGLKANIVDYFHTIRATRELQFTRRSLHGPRFIHSEEGLLGKGTLNENQFNGPFLFLYSFGNKKAEGVFNQKGEKHGTFTFYYFNGKLKATEVYQNGKQHGKQSYFYDNGSPESVVFMKEDEADGEMTSYYYNGVTRSIEPYSQGKLHGVKKTFYKNGALELEESWVNGKRHGPTKTYYKNGQIETEGVFANDELEGPFKTWNSWGVLQAEGQYTQGKLHGVLRRYHLNGQIRSVETYDKGVLEGVYIQYHENGKEAFRYNNTKGTTTGEVNYYDTDGKLFSTLVFENDIIKAGRYFDKNGKQISSSETRNGRLDLVGYTPQGTKRNIVPYDAAGEVDGVRIYYFGSGKERIRETYSKGELQGNTTAIYPNGKKNYTIDFDKGGRSGYYQSWYPNGSLQVEGWYEEDKIQGEWLQYDKQGKLSMKTSYLNDLRHGLRSEYWPNGIAHTVTQFQADNPVALWEYDTTGKLIHQVQLKAGTGQFKSVYPTGKLYSECTYKNYDIEGPRKFYFFDGSLNVVQNFVHGLLDGEYKVYSYGGKLQMEGQYRMDEKEGTWKHYSDKGELHITEEYKAGKVDGKITFYYPNGKIDTEIEFHNDERHGLYKRYAEDGTLMYQIRYDEGLEVGYSYLNSKGELVPEIPLIQGNGKLKAFYPNGTPSAVIDFVDGLQHGEVIRYHPNGKTAAKNKQVYDETHGESIEYYTDGKIRSTCQYENDNRHGLYKEFNSKGILIEEGNYYDDRRHGEHRYYDDNGKLKQTRYYYYGLLLDVK